MRISCKYQFTKSELEFQKMIQRFEKSFFQSKKPFCFFWPRNVFGDFILVKIELVEPKMFFCGCWNRQMARRRRQLLLLLLLLLLHTLDQLELNFDLVTSSDGVLNWPHINWLGGARAQSCKEKSLRKFMLSWLWAFLRFILYFSANHIEA